MADAARAARLADRIKVIVAQALERRVKDPRLGFVTLTDSRVTNDLQHATLYYTVYGDQTQREDTARALESAKGVLRSEVGRNITARLTPTLTFVADEIPADAARLESVLRAAREKDARVAEQAQGARYAAGPDAYRISDDAESAEDEAAADPDDAPRG